MRTIRCILSFVTLFLVVSATHAGIPTQAGTGQTPTATQPRDKAAHPIASTCICPEPSCDDITCPIPPKYFVNNGQLCTSLLAHWRGTDYCRYTINQAIRVHFQVNGDHIFVTEGKRAFGVAKDQAQEAAKDIANASWDYLLTYWIDYYLTHGTLMYLVLLPLLRFFLRAALPIVVSDWIGKWWPWRAVNKLKKDE